MRVPKLEVDLGIEVYASETPGIGGKIRLLHEDFLVQEMLTDGSKASFQPELSEVSGWGRYVLCVLVKKNWETLIAIKEIAKHLCIHQDRIQIAGMKDTKALTAQHITVSGVLPEKISKIEIKDMTVEPLRFVDEKLSPRLLFGNRFQIKIGAIEHHKEIVEKRIERINRELENLGGLPNYFGHQRFGTIRPITHVVGHHIIKGDFEKATLTFLSKTSEFEHSDSREARQRLESTQDFKAALDCFPKRLVYERLMLKHLAKYPRDFLGAFHRLPLRLRRLSIQAYQSLLFNKFLSERMRRCLPISKAQIGDYVVDLDENQLPTNSFSKTEAPNISRINKEISEGNMAFAMPLIGFKQFPSGGVQGEIEEEILEKEEIDPQDFHIQKMPKISTPGGLRTGSTSVLDFYVEDEPPSPNGLNVKLSFTLHRGSYATILLREFMKPKDPVKAGF